jgi:hypothetical protein
MLAVEPSGTEKAPKTCAGTLNAGEPFVAEPNHEVCVEVFVVVPLRHGELLLNAPSPCAVRLPPPERAVSVAADPAVLKVGRGAERTVTRSVRDAPAGAVSVVLRYAVTLAVVPLLEPLTPRTVEAVEWKALQLSPLVHTGGGVEQVTS